LTQTNKCTHINYICPPTRQKRSHQLFYFSLYGKYG